MRKKTSEAIAPPVRIEIAGGIASGKTTLARLLRRIGLRPVLEDFRANPFLLDFYRDQASVAFETEIGFALLHHRDLLRAHLTGVSFAADFSFSLDSAYALANLRSQSLEVFKALHQELRRHIPPPTLTVYLECNASEQLRRIRKRNRAFERSISVSYLRSVNRMLRKEMASQKRGYRGLPIQSDAVDFAHDLSARRFVAELVEASVDAGK